VYYTNKNARGTLQHLSQNIFQQKYMQIITQLFIAQY